MEKFHFKTSLFLCWFFNSLDKWFLSPVGISGSDIDFSLLVRITLAWCYCLVRNLSFLTFNSLTVLFRCLTSARRPSTSALSSSNCWMKCEVNDSHSLRTSLDDIVLPRSSKSKSPFSNDVQLVELIWGQCDRCICVMGLWLGRAIKWWWCVECALYGWCTLCI